MSLHSQGRRESCIAGRPMENELILSLPIQIARTTASSKDTCRALRDRDWHDALPRRKFPSHLRSHFRRATLLRLQGCESHPFPSGARTGKAALFGALLVGFSPGPEIRLRSSDLLLNGG